MSELQAVGGMGLLERYERWVRSNAAAVVAAEGALSSLTWLVPDRFADSELTLEALNSVLGLLSMYHGRILGGPDSSEGGAPAPARPALAAVAGRAAPGVATWCLKRRYILSCQHVSMPLSSATRAGTFELLLARRTRQAASAAVDGHSVTRYGVTSPPWSSSLQVRH